MFGLDEQLAQLGDGSLFAVVAVVAVLLGLRHATDPDHLAAVTALLAGDSASPRHAGRLGLTWGMGHATSLLAFGAPIVVYDAYLPPAMQTAAETAVGVMIIALAARLLHRWRRGSLHRHDGSPRPARSPIQAYGIGLMHGVGGSAGVGVLLLAAIPGHGAALAALAVFALCSAAAMGVASATFGLAFARQPVVRRHSGVVPALGGLSLAFGAWYALAALHTVPYIF
jgi:hypothetical protein